MFLCNPNSVAGQKIAQITLLRKTDSFSRFQLPFKVHQEHNFKKYKSQLQFLISISHSYKLQSKPGPVVIPRSGTQRHANSIMARAARLLNSYMYQVHLYIHIHILLLLCKTARSGNQFKVILHYFLHCKSVVLRC